MLYAWLADLIPPPHTREQLTFRSFFQGILTPILCYYVTAVLVLLPGTRPVRWALLPLTLWTAFCGATRIDLVLGFCDERLIYWNQGLLLVFTTIGMRVIIWSFQQTPYTRFRNQVARPKDPKISLKVAIDALDLCFNLRGCGWDWSDGLQVPPESRPTTSTTAFTRATFVSLINHIVLFDIIHYSVQWFSPSTIGSSVGGSIFNPTMSPAFRYLRSSTITLLSGLVVYCAIQTIYLLSTLVGILVFRQDVSSWPPAFKTPWLSTSLTEFWAQRWHQMFRNSFISLGGNPLSLIAGRVGGVMGTFLMSGILHDFGLWGMGRGADFSRVGGFFLMMGAGVVLEGLWKKLTGYKTGGYIGWIWTIAWVIGWGNLIVDAWATKGLVGSIFLPIPLRPSTYIFGALTPNTL